jgi:hypothetical protein
MVAEVERAQQVRLVLVEVLVLLHQHLVLIHLPVLAVVLDKQVQVRKVLLVLIIQAHPEEVVVVASIPAIPTQRLEVLVVEFMLMVQLYQDLTQVHLLTG